MGTLQLAHVVAVDDVVVVLVAAAGMGYVAAVRVLRSRGGRWPVGRSAGAVVGAVAVAGALTGWVGAHDTSRFSAHAVQHVLLGLVTPLAVVLAAPLTLALRVAAPSTRRRLRRWSTSAPLRLLTHPLVAAPLFTATTVAMYFTPLYRWSLRSDLVHAALHTHLVLVGLAFFWPLVGADPAPVRVPHVLRLGLLFIVLPLHALTAVALLDTTTIVGGATAERRADASGVDPAHEQRTGAGILWAAGDLIALAAVAAAAHRWWKAETAEGSSPIAPAPGVGSAPAVPGTATAVGPAGPPR